MPIDMIPINRPSMTKLWLGHVLTFRVQDVKKKAIEGALVRIFDKNDRIVFSGATNYEGLVTEIVVDTLLFQQYPVDPTRMVCEEFLQVSLCMQADGFAPFRAILTVANSLVGIVTLRIPGDANSDGVVDVNDLMVWNANKFTAGTWEDGDFNQDGRVDVADWNILNEARRRPPQ